MLQPILTPVRVEMVFHMQRPKSHFAANGDVCRGTLAAVPAVKPDIDNLAKLVLDALSGKVYEDDKQVLSISATKRYASDKNPKTEVAVFHMSGSTTVASSSAASSSSSSSSSAAASSSSSSSSSSSLSMAPVAGGGGGGKRRRHNTPKVVDLT